MTLPTSHSWLVRVLDAYAQGTIGWDLSYACTDAAARELASDDDRQAALDAWGLFMDAHTIRIHLGRDMKPGRRLKFGRASIAVARAHVSHDLERIEREECHTEHASARLERTER